MVLPYVYCTCHAGFYPHIALLHIIELDEKTTALRIGENQHCFVWNTVVNGSAYGSPNMEFLHQNDEKCLKWESGAVSSWRSEALVVLLSLNSILRYGISNFWRISCLEFIISEFYPIRFSYILVTVNEEMEENKQKIKHNPRVEILHFCGK